MAGPFHNDSRPEADMPILSRMNLRRERGQAVVELALVLPLMLLLLLGIVQFGTVFRDYIALTDATRVGARQGSVSRSIQPPADRETTIVARVKKAGVNLDPNKMTVSVELRDPVTGAVLTPNSADTSWVQNGDVTVRATYPFRISLIGMVFYTGILQSRTTERIE
jgi:Flp pilus assembly protein TadG